LFTAVNVKEKINLSIENFIFLKINEVNRILLRERGVWQIVLLTKGTVIRSSKLQQRGKRSYVKRAVKPEPEEVSLTEFNRNLLHLVKTKAPKKDSLLSKKEK